MHKVVIVSDSHGLTDELQEIKTRHDADVYIHCGDSELDLDAPELEGYTTVKGNCDFSSPFPLEEVMEIGGLRFFISHGHITQVKSTLLNLQYRAKELNAEVVCFGHNHIAYAEKIDETIFINPGSIRYPNRIKEPSYTVLEWDSKAAIYCTFYDIDGEELDFLPYQKYFSLS